MSQFKIGLTCEDCQLFRDLAGVVDDCLGKCQNKESDHYNHYISRMHPSCGLIDRKETQ